MASDIYCADIEKYAGTGLGTAGNVVIDGGLDDKAQTAVDSAPARIVYPHRSSIYLTDHDRAEDIAKRGEGYSSGKSEN
jgi:hypothetical protein